jgi:predicted dehydrogenase
MRRYRPFSGSLAVANKILHVAIVGCGKIADQHVQAIRRVKDCEITATCDREILMAGQLAERFRIPRWFSDAREMLAQVNPHVVHITTPPESHFPLALQCLEAGSHVYLEKPFTITAAEAQALITTAESKGVKITAGHNYQFTLEMLEMRRLVREGFLGGLPVHLESHWPYDFAGSAYAAALLGSRNHWVRSLAGRLLHNIISHGIAKLAEFLDSDIIELTAIAHQSEGLKSLGGGDVLDELRVLIRDKKGTTAFFCFSSQIKPGLNWLRICGPANSLVVDHMTGSVLRYRNRPFKSYLTYLVRPFVDGREHVNNGMRNIKAFIRRSLHHDFGMKELIERFYDSIRSEGDPPIPYREILLTTRIMDEIFAQIYPANRTMRAPKPQEGMQKHAEEPQIAAQPA